MSKLESILIDKNNTSAIFCKLLTKNDDSGRHGIVVPIDAYPMLPNFRIKTTGSHFSIPCEYTVWANNGSQSRISNINYKYYHQGSHAYPERRLTSFKSKELNQSSPKDLFILAKRNKDYEAHFIPAENDFYDELLKELSLEASPAGAFVIDLKWHKSDSFTLFPALEELLEEFDSIKGEYHKTINPSSQGVGTTFENLLGIKPNNSQIADYKGIELKAYKLKDNSEPYDQDLFLKEPRWIKDPSRIKVKSKEVVKKFGYIDEKGRQALKVRLSIKPNIQELYVKVDKEAEEILIMYKDSIIGYWTFSVMKKRLLEKHKHVAFIGADSRKTGADEEFQYKSLTYCGSPSSEEFAKMINLSHIKIELRMHINDNGTTRNHGTQFRIKAQCLKDLYSIHQNLR
jgi:hypothetical protein